MSHGETLLVFHRETRGELVVVQDLFTEDVQAYRRIRDYAATATFLEINALHWVVQDGMREGRSVREVASLVKVPPATIHRHRRERPVIVKNSWGEKVPHYQCRRVPDYAGPEALQADLALQYGPCGPGKWLSFHRRIREVSAAAQDWEDSLFRMCIMDGVDGGMSVRQIASVLGVPPATAARRRNASFRSAPPVWATPLTYSSVEEVAWSHAPHRIEGRVPYEWTDHPDGSRSVRIIPAGVAVRRP